MNPVKAGLVATPEEFLWSSAGPIENRPQIENLPHNATPSTTRPQAASLPRRIVAG
jgi:hypothetical protein